MTYSHTPKLWLLATAALIFGSHVSASAQSLPNYQAGAPTMVAAAPSLPSIPAEQIARDVTSDFKPRTGQRELVAAPFDPFEDDPNLAASLRLRSADGAVAIDGQPLRDGALVEVDFYYNSPSDDPYGGRNYSDAGFINGDLAHVVKRDTRILECSTRVENVVYDQASYYGPGYSVGIYRPYRHYAGHSAFGFGFGSSYFGPGYGFYGGSRIGFNQIGFGSRSFSRNRSIGSPSLGSSRNTTRSRTTADRNRDRADRRRDRADRNRDRDDSSRADRNRRNLNGESAGNRNRDVSRRRQNASRLTNREVDDRASRVQSFGVGRNGNEVRRNARNSGVASGVNTRARVEVAPTGTQPAVSQSATTSNTPSQSSGSETRRSQPRRSEGQRSATNQSSANRSEGRRSETRRSETRSNSSNSRSNSRSSSRSNSRTNSRSNSRPTARSTTPRRRTSQSNNKRKLNFFPHAGHGGRSVVTTQSVDCAREDKLTVFIPNDRLDAARFDGLTLIALDAQGGESPIYLPPNYIEGFRLAATGRVAPQGQSSGGGVTHTPQIVTPQIVTPVPQNRTWPQTNPQIESAPCPAGTSKQQDGTCLQTDGFGYPQ